MLNIDNARSAIVIAMEMLIYINILRLFLKISYRKLRVLFISTYIVLLTITIINSSMQYLYYTKTALTFLSLTIITMFLLKTKFFKTIFLVFIYAILMLMGNVFAIFTTMFTLDVSTMEIQNETGLFFAANLLSFSVVALLLYILKYVLLYKSYGKSVQIKSKNIVFYIFTVFSMLFINFYTFLYHASEMNVFISILHILLIIAYITISLNYTFLENDFLYQKILYKNQQEYLKVIENLLSGYRELKHGWKNYLTGFSGFIYTEERNWEELVEYYESVVKTTKHLTKDSLSVLTKIKNHVLIGMFVEKINEAEARGVNLNINIVGGKIHLEENYDFLMDLNFMLGNFLDNAIRHSCDADMPIIWIEIYCGEDYVSFMIKNTFSPAFLEDKQRFDGGYGLKLVAEKVKKYPFILHSTIMDEDVFIQELIVEGQDIKNTKDFKTEKEVTF